MWKGDLMPPFMLSPKDEGGEGKLYSPKPKVLDLYLLTFEAIEKNPMIDD